jgi:group I intron endonuclease
MLKLLKGQCKSCNGWYLEEGLKKYLESKIPKAVIPYIHDYKKYIPTGEDKGIYKITNLKNGKFYYGSSNNIMKRWWEHKKQLKLNNHVNVHLQAAWNKYGEENFIFEVEKIMNNNTEEQILKEEQKYLDLYVGKNECYNTSKVAEKPDWKLNCIPVQQLNKDTGILIKEWISAEHAERELNLFNIGLCCKGKQISSGGYRWQYKDEKLRMQYNIKIGQHGGHRKQSIIRYDPKTMNIIKEYNSFAEAGKDLGIKPETIVPVCKGRRTSIRSMFFKYKNEFEYIKQNGINELCEKGEIKCLDECN